MHLLIRKIVAHIFVWLIGQFDYFGWLEGQFFLLDTWVERIHYAETWNECFSFEILSKYYPATWQEKKVQILNYD
jgi:hypothetical protein